MSADEERQALLGIALASLPNEEEVRDALFPDDEREPPRLAEALASLGTLTEQGRRLSHRVLSLDLLARIPARRGLEVLQPAEAELYRFAEQAVVEGERIAAARVTKGERAVAARADGPDRDLERAQTEVDLAAEPEEAEASPAGADAPMSEPRSSDPRVDQTVDALRKTVGLLPERGHHWTAFANEARSSLNLSDEEVDRPLCTDEQIVVMPNGLEAVRTAVWFWSPKPAKDFASWTDPRTWDKSCHLFFKSVVPKAPTTISTSSAEFRGTFTETVFTGGAATLSTDLEFCRSVDEPWLYALEFDLPPPPLPAGAQIVVDAGQVTVREDPLAPESRRTVLLAEKYVRFADPAYLTWPTLACDTFWTEFAITMALGC